LISTSLKPTVDAAYPRAQSFSPLKFFCLPPNCRATAMADFPFRYPTTSATEYFGESKSACGHGLEPVAQKQFCNSFAVQELEMFALNTGEFFHIASYAYILVQRQCDNFSHI
jgi:hypothetical protein